MFTIITQDGRTIDLLDSYEVEFHAVRYTGHINYNYVDVEIRRRGKKGWFNITLAEFADYNDADHTCKIVENEYRSHVRNRITKFFMPGNTVGIAPNDDLMATIAELDRLCPKGWSWDFAMIDGKTTCPAVDRIPDSSGSYRDALIQFCNCHSLSLDTKEALTA